MTTDGSAKSLAEYLAVIRRRSWLVAFIAMIAVGASAAYTFTRPSVYRASMKIVVGQGEGIFPPEVGNVAEQFTATMTDLLETEVVLNKAIERLDLDTTPAGLLEDLRVITAPSTAVLEVTYDDTDRVRGRQVLAAIGQAFTEEVAARLVPPEGDPALAVTARIFDPAHFVPGAVSPKPTINLGLAGVLGLLFGLVAAFARDRLHDTVRTVEQVEALFGQAATATVPPVLLGYHPLGDRRRTRKRDYASVLAQLAAQKLRASIQWSPASREARILVATSAGPEEGKSTVVANLAVAMAEEGYSVIAVEADLRRPILHTYLGVPVGPSTISIDAIIRGDGELEASLVEIPLAASRLSAQKLTGGARSPTEGTQGRLRAILGVPGRTLPSEFRLGATLALMNELRAKADYVIFDAPPILLVTDPYPLVAAADMVLAVVRLGRERQSAIRELRQTIARLRDSRGIELLVTDVEPDSRSGSYYDYALALPHFPSRPEGNAAASSTSVRGREPQPSSGRSTGFAADK